jgi:hypothetical protein
MRKALFLCLSVMIALTGSSARAWAPSQLDEHSFKTFGGTYMSDCTIATSAKVTVFAESLVFLDGSKRIAGNNVQASASWYGNESPPEFRTALMSEATGGQMVFIVNQDRQGYYINITGDQKVALAIGKPLLAKKFRRCDGAAKAANPPPAPQQRSYTLVELDAGGVLLDPKAKAAYYKALGPLVRQHWLAQLDGPSPQNKAVKVGAADFVLIVSCMNRDCEQNNVVVLYSPVRGVAYGKVFQRGRSTLIGAPPVAIARELERHWQSYWGRK